MATFLVVLWLFALTMMFKLAYVVKDLMLLYQPESDLSDSVGAFVVTVLYTGIVTVAFSVALCYDLYGPEIWESCASTPILISGLVCLGLTSLSAFALPRIVAFIASSTRRKLSEPSVKHPWWRVAGVFELIGLLASILGILSFYLDYLR